MNTNEKIPGLDQHKPLRLWPGIVLAILLLLIRYIILLFKPETFGFAVMGGLAISLVIMIWWVFFSSAPRIERWSAVVLMIAGLVVTFLFLHKSISTGNMGMMFPMHSIPVVTLAIVAWAVVSKRLSVNLRHATMVIFILLACGGWILIRSEGINGYGRPQLVWRWAKTSEERLLAKTGDNLLTMTLDSAAMATEAEWPGFRGPDRDDIVYGVRIQTDWSKTPPIEIWRRSIGPGCSSFAVHGAFLYTQEQRGEYEMVTCYNIKTGEPVWIHRDSTRFWDSHAGAGPRSTPALSNGRVYTLGATGILNVLDANNGKLVWSQNVASETNTKSPNWAFAGSPLVVNDLVIAAVAGTLIACDRSTGSLRWSLPAGGDCYSSPHLFNIKGVEQMLIMNETGLTGVDPGSGQVLWKHEWKGNPILQPALTSEGDILISSSATSGIRRLTVLKGPDGWTAKECWTSAGMKPNYDDFVVHKGNLYGYDGLFLACIDTEKGNTKWRGGRYGGQLILLADQDLLLVLSEKGELALVRAIPEQFSELARFPAIEGKTWNHPVLVGDVLVVRNAQEMAAFRLPLASN